MQLLTFQHTTLRDVFLIGLSASLKHSRGRIVIQFTVSSACGAVL